jgi:hypothetical protein
MMADGMKFRLKNHVTHLVDEFEIPKEYLWEELCGE